MSACESNPVDRLTEAQQKCLRLVLAHMTSKQIARELGISPHTVDAHVKASLKTLGVANRTEAALMLTATNSDPAYQRLAYQSVGMVRSPQSRLFPSHGHDPACDVDYAELVQSKDENKQNCVQDKVVAAEFSELLNAKKLRGISDYIGDAKCSKNKFSTTSRLGIIFLISITSIVIFSILLSSIKTISSIYS